MSASNRKQGKAYKKNKDYIDIIDGSKGLGVTGQVCRTLHERLVEFAESVL